jgi:putative nucleotidyltransferase with HDIG domain
MSFSPTINEQRVLADTRRRTAEPLVSRELGCEIAAAAGFLACVAGLWVAQPPEAFALVPAALCLAVLVVATKVSFETPFGFTVATQLAFVPLVFAVPGALVPLAVVVALALARLPEIISGDVPARRLLRTLGNSWFSIGPVAVFALAGSAPRTAGPTLLMLALFAQLGLDFTVSAIRTWIERGASLIVQLREMIWVYGIDVALSVIALIVAEDIHRTPIATLAPLPLLALLAIFARERRDRITSLLELSNAYRGTALVLGDVIEADDRYTGEHCRSVVALAVVLADRLGLSADERRNVEFAALLHDVGKIAIPKEIINKPGTLTAQEWTVIETHTVEGQKLLDRIGGFMQTVGRIVRSHHERWDGGGYPDGLAGEQIPVEARIISCCDSWNAMRSDRSYRKALPHEAARAELLANSGGQFDPHIVEIFLTLVDEASTATSPASDAAVIGTALAL